MKQFLCQTCKTCGATDPGQFHKSDISKTGLRATCKTCKKARHSELHPKQLRIKACPRCGETDLGNFYKHANRADGLQNYCKPCHNNEVKTRYPKNRAKRSLINKRRYAKRLAENPAKLKADNAENFRKWAAKYPAKAAANRMRYYACLSQQTPIWADYAAIANFYKSKPASMSVDHIIPLRGELVSGLHVLSNLQYLTKAENSRKKNKVNLEDL